MQMYRQGVVKYITIMVRSLTLLGVEDVVVSGSVEDVDVRITVLGEVVMDGLVSDPSVKIHHPDLDPCRRSQT